MSAWPQEASASCRTARWWWRALTRLRNLGLRSVYLRGNAAPPTPDEITAVLHHPDGLIWRTAPDNGVASSPELVQELWRPIRALLRRPTPQT